MTPRLYVLSWRLEAISQDVSVTLTTDFNLIMKFQALLNERRAMSLIVRPRVDTPMLPGPVTGMHLLYYQFEACSSTCLTVTSCLSGSDRWQYELSFLGLGLQFIAFHRLALHYLAVHHRSPPSCLPLVYRWFLPNSICRLDTTMRQCPRGRISYVSFFHIPKP